MIELDERLADETLLAIAAKNNLSETAFVVVRGEPLLRWFPPSVENDRAALHGQRALYIEGKTWLPRGR